MPSPTFSGPAFLIYPELLVSFIFPRPLMQSAQEKNVGCHSTSRSAPLMTREDPLSDHWCGLYFRSTIDSRSICGGKIRPAGLETEKEEWPGGVALGVIQQKRWGRLLSLCLLLSSQRESLVLGTELPSGPKGPPEFALQHLEVGVLCVGEEGGKHGLCSLQNLHSIPRSTTNWPWPWASYWTLWAFIMCNMRITSTFPGWL